MFQIDFDTFKNICIMRENFCQNALKNPLGQGKRNDSADFLGTFVRIEIHQDLCLVYVLPDFRSTSS